MIRGKGFLQMFSIPPVSSGAAAPHLDFHLDTHNLIKETDYGKQSEAREESKHNDTKSSSSTDRDGHVHYYDHGRDLASNDDRSDRSDRNGFMNDDGKWNG
jgi:hypothetical protein